ncbi:pilus assembly protein PilM [uncultured Ilyobacter sp.]|uniref:pilus assembly protein PilM n=1 Tax=uncultured Ilyobacter sp. TaxID=544433 RepID=UPI0029C728FF|nr:pilus assembly protein PilM [uncultured Ilyobacter sp.]
MKEKFIRARERLDNLVKEKSRGSIDIGSRGIKALSIKGGIVGDVLVEKFNQNEEKETQINEILSVMIERLGFKGHGISLSLPSQKFQVKFIRISQENMEKRDQFILEEMEEIIPGYSEDEYLTEKVTVNLDEYNEEVLCVTIKREEIDYLLNFLESLRVKVLKIIPDFVSIFMLLDRMESNDEKEENINSYRMIVDVGHESTKIYALNKEVMNFYRFILMGGNEFIDIIKNYKEINYEKAEEKIIELELQEQNQEILDASEKSMMDELTEAFKELESQIRLSYEYYFRERSSSIVEELVFVGGGSLLRGLKEYVKKSLELDIMTFELEKITSKEENRIKLEPYQFEEIAVLLGNVMDEVV